MKLWIFSSLLLVATPAFASEQVLVRGQAVIVCAVGPSSYQATEALNGILLGEQNQVTYQQNPSSTFIIVAPYSVSAPALTSYSQATSTTDQACVTITKL